MNFRALPPAIFEILTVEECGLNKCCYECASHMAKAGVTYTELAQPVFCYDFSMQHCNDCVWTSCLAALRKNTEWVELLALATGEVPAME